MDATTRHTVINLIIIAGGTMIMIGLIGNHSKIPGRLFRWRLASLLCILNGFLGLSFDYLNMGGIRVYSVQLHYSRLILEVTVFALLIPLLLNWQRLKSNKKMSPQ